MSARVLVVGAGAIGGITAAHLARAGQEVVVLDANAEHVALLGHPGLQLDHLGTPITVPIQAVTSADKLEGHFDFALLTLKAGFLAPALTELLKHDVVSDYVCLGNGLVQDVVEGLVGSERLLIGVTEWGGTNLGPGRLAQTTIAPFIIGEPAGGTERLERLAGALGHVAEVVVTDRISSHVWSKLLLNSTFSGLGAISGGLYSDVAAHEVGRRLAYRVWTEGYDVATAAGVDLDPILGVDPRDLVVRTTADEPRASQAVDHIVARLGATKASMLQDLERGALTEVDVINGGVVTTARRVGVTAPRANMEIVEYVHHCEGGSARPEPASFDRVAEAVEVWGR